MARPNAAPSKAASSTLRERPERRLADEVGERRRAPAARPPTARAIWLTGCQRAADRGVPSAAPASGAAERGRGQDGAARRRAGPAGAAGAGRVRERRRPARRRRRRTRLERAGDGQRARGEQPCKSARTTRWARPPASAPLSDGRRRRSAAPRCDRATSSRAAIAEHDGGRARGPGARRRESPGPAPTTAWRPCPAPASAAPPPHGAGDRADQRADAGRAAPASRDERGAVPQAEARPFPVRFAPARRPGQRHPTRPPRPSARRAGRPAPGRGPDGRAPPPPPPRRRGRSPAALRARGHRRRRPLGDAAISRSAASLDRRPGVAGRGRRRRCCGRHRRPPAASGSSTTAAATNW